MVPLETNKRHEIETAAARQGMHQRRYKPFGHNWGHPYFGKWQTISHALFDLLPSGASVLDVGCGSGWTTVFLAESGFRATGVDLAPASIEDATSRARRYHSPAAFATGFRRYFEGTAPHDGRPMSLIWQTARLWGARASTAPRMSVWLAAQAY